MTLPGDLRPNKTLSFNPRYQVNDIVLPAGALVTYLLSLRGNVSFSTNVLTSASVQYNSTGQLAAPQAQSPRGWSRTLENPKLDSVSQISGLASELWWAEALAGPAR